MKVYVNDEEREIYPGMLVKHALTAEEVKSVEENLLIVKDSYGHIIGLEGSLHEGDRIYLIKNNAT